MSDPVPDAEHYRDLVENAGDLIYAHELAGRFTWVNKAFQRATGCSRRECLRLGIFDLLAPDSREAMAEAILEMLGGDLVRPVELVLVPRRGPRTVLDACCRLLFREGVPSGVQCIARDITGRKQAEALERDRNRVLELVAAGEPLDGILNSLALLVETQMPGVRCAVLLARNGRLSLGASPSLPRGYSGIFDEPEPCQAEAAYGSMLQCRSFEAVSLESDPALRAHFELLREEGLRVVRAAPILSREASPVGAFLLYSAGDEAPGPRGALAIEAAERLAVVAVDQRRLAESLSHQARHDALTGLPNRRQFERILADALEDAGRHNHLLAVFFIDLDGFKRINDTLGHFMGDKVLCQVAARLEGSLRRSDSLARLGGDEFGLVLGGLAGTQDALQVGKKLLDALDLPFTVESHQMFLSASIGISFYPRDGKSAASLEGNADAAMYRAKSRGRNQIEFYSPEIGAAALERMSIEGALRGALENREFRLHYQPLLDAAGRLDGLEALLVWKHPERGSMLPGHFIPVAEDSGLIIPIGAWALQEACRQGALWQRAGMGARIAVNVSAVQFSAATFVEVVSEALAGSGLEPSLLELELTETAVMRSPEDARQQMDRLRALGVRISIDDFGTGYSSLSRLRRLPIDALKIDRAFLEQVDEDPNTLPLLRAIVALAHGLGLNVVAEGVETPRQWEAAREAGCDLFQGRLLGGPVPPEDLSGLLAGSGRVLTWGSPDEKGTKKV